MTLKAVVEVKKSFDVEKTEFSKAHEAGDFREFFEKEGGYLDNLSGAVKELGNTGEGFTVVYTVKVTKED